MGPTTSTTRSSTVIPIGVVSTDSPGRHATSIPNLSSTGLHPNLNPFRLIFEPGLVQFSYIEGFRWTTGLEILL